MSSAERFEIGTQVVCSDGDCGEVLRAVIDPTTNTITHLAVGPKHDSGEGRLVPIELVSATGETIKLACSRTEFDALDPALDGELLPQATQAFQNMQSRPYEVTLFGLANPFAFSPRSGEVGGQQPGMRIFDRVPAGEVEVRGGDPVEATDGAIGHVRGLVVDPADHHVTHVLLDEGHLWGKRQVAIPIGQVERIGLTVHVKLTKHEIGELEPVDLEHPL